MKAPTNGPLFMGMYKELCEVARKHGYAMAVHGSLIRDFDIVCIPWAEIVSTPDKVIKALGEEYRIERVQEPTQKNHGRVAYVIHFAFGDCYIDLSFMPTKIV